MSGPAKRVTIRDVAKHAGVSVATVSRTLAGDYPVQPATRHKVLQAVGELDYVRNAHARALSVAAPGAVAIVINSVATAYYSYIAQGVEEQATAEGRLCLICTTGGDPQRELAVVQMMREQRAEAVILVGSVIQDDDYKRRMTRYAHSLADSGSCLALCGRPPLGDGVPAFTVGFDNTGGAHAITTHLLSAGHRRILYLGLRLGQSTSDSRVAGYRTALADFGAVYDPELEVGCGYDRSSGYAAMKHRLAAGAGDFTRDFTAVFAATDVIAAGAFQAIREHGLRIPDDISIVGYDDTPPAEDIGLTTVHLPHAELGRAAVRLALSGKNPLVEAPITLGTHIVVRNSVKRVGNVR
ncbi:LacI family DNA-binding transcriptional regulator [Nonomuraea rubra]|uniref:LacI family transcriptional regulator n=1 Tax=Nonomuraea rubra TaxID=46180 RepID=A0A7X0P166_9ACTN|nr:LacI family DNA-binding transcriptional regulator [Nonomuraea rubra]MBB6553377.1 LacI family transcriptional regulator [Nonomuraea rubra]